MSDIGTELKVQWSCPAERAQEGGHYEERRACTKGRVGHRETGGFWLCSVCVRGC